METHTFVASKKIEPYIEFDKEHQAFRLIASGEVYAYKDLVSCRVTSLIRNKGVNGSIFKIVEYSLLGHRTPNSEMVQSCVELKLRNDEIVYCVISEKPIPRSTVQFVEDDRMARIVRRALDVVIKRNQESNEADA